MNVRVTAKVIGDNGDTNEDENRSGFQIFVDGHEITRVAFVRRFSSNPEVSFEDALDAEIKKAQHAKAQYEALFEGAGELQ